MSDKRAAYGKKIVATPSQELTAEFGIGYTTGAFSNQDRTERKEAVTGWWQVVPVLIKGAWKIMIKRVWYAVIGILCFLVVAAVLAIPSLLLPPGVEIGSMPAAYGIAAIVSYCSTPIIYRKIEEMRKR